MTRLTRRTALASFATATVFQAHADAANPIKIGMPLALTGPLGSVGEQMRRGAEIWAKTVNAKGGVLGRPIQLFISDTGGDPATCVRKAQEAVEREDCRLLFGMTLSSEALAVVPKLAEWNAIFI
jgi:branched-chain amino acid transport system substrate-binding protein